MATVSAFEQRDGSITFYYPVYVNGNYVGEQMMNATVEQVKNITKYSNTEVIQNWIKEEFETVENFLLYLELR